MINIIIKALEKLAALFLALAVLFLAVFGLELTSCRAVFAARELKSQNNRNDVSAICVAPYSRRVN